MALKYRVYHGTIKNVSNNVSDPENVLPTILIF